MFPSSRPKRTWMPGDWISVSITPTRRPAAASSAATFAAVLDLPVPPRNEWMAMVAPMEPPLAGARLGCLRHVASLCRAQPARLFLQGAKIVYLGDRSHLAQHLVAAGGAPGDDRLHVAIEAQPLIRFLCWHYSPAETKAFIRLSPPLRFVRL